MSDVFKMDKGKTALVVIDLQKGITQMQGMPHTAQEVVANATKLVKTFRQNNSPVFLVHVQGTPETMLKVLTDETWSRPANMPVDWADFVDDIAPTPSDVVITKKQWGAFYGTDLELQLRRRGIDTIVLCGIATDYGVESTARFAYEYGFNQVFAEDAMTSRSKEQHDASVNFVLKRIGRVRKTDQIVAALK